MRRTFGGLTIALLVAGLLTACGQGDERERAAPATTQAVVTEKVTRQESTADVAPTKIDITGKDYAFDVPATMQGGLVEISFFNAGREPHFAGFAKVAPGKTFDDARAALTAPPGAVPPAGPPPLEDFGGASTIEPGARSKLAFNLPAGTYALYCQIPSPDGIPHGNKGMITQLTVTEGSAGRLPASVGTVVATDFAFNPVPPLRAGTNVVRVRNEGKQIHELNLVELGSGKTAEDVADWYRQPAGPPPMRFAGGVAIKPGEEATAELDMKAGTAYAYICEIPDFLGDFNLHVTKGMYTKPFSVS
ncbi:MAG: hypothetical protein ABR592_00795 [Nitriliruptorales bacterium]